MPFFRAFPHYICEFVNLGIYSPDPERRCVLCVYSNAADVLPPDLLRAVQKHWRGLLYVPPAPDSPQKEDTEFIRSMIRSGCSAANIATVAGVTTRRVYQIARMLGPENPYQRRKVTEKVTEE